MLTLTEIATPDILPPVRGRILKFKVQQEFAGSGKAYKKHLLYQEVKLELLTEYKGVKGMIALGSAFP